MRFDITDRTKAITLWAVTRVGVLHLVVFIFLMIGVNHVRLVTKTINAYHPGSMEYLTVLADGKTVPDKTKLRQYRKYFEVVSRYTAQGPFELGTLGFIYYHLGDLNRALKYYGKAIDLYPFYLNYYYNSSLILLQKNALKRALPLLLNALQKSKPGQNLTMVYYSRGQMGSFVVQDGVSQEDYLRRLDKDYQDTVFLLVAGLIYSSERLSAAEIIQKLTNAGKADGRVLCLQKYLSSEEDGGIRDPFSPFETCRQILGWSEVPRENMEGKDPFGLRRLPLKLW